MEDDTTRKKKTKPKVPSTDDFFRRHTRHGVSFGCVAKAVSISASVAAFAKNPISYSEHVADARRVAVNAKRLADHIQSQTALFVWLVAVDFLTTLYRLDGFSFLLIFLHLAAERVADSDLLLDGIRKQQSPSSSSSSTQHPAMSKA